VTLPLSWAWPLRAALSIAAWRTGSENMS
jgi:hypothetical protein